MDIVTIHSTQSKYFVASRKFELPELKLLIDAVAVSYTHLDVYKRQSVINARVKGTVCLTYTISYGNTLRAVSYTHLAIRDPRNFGGWSIRWRVMRLWKNS